jgi:iron complex outermembrane recepter protein
MRKVTQRALLCGTAIMLAVCATPASAQDEAPQNEAIQRDFSDIVVTARRVEERLQDVPISITVFNQEQLNSRNITNSSDLATYTPSLSANPNFGTENTTFAIRGFTQEIGTAPSVGVYFADVITPRGASNGLPTGDGLAPGMLFDLQNVQVLKGPQGTLFGRNTTGGAVLVVPQKPTDRLEGYVEGSIGNYDLRRVQAVANVPLSDTFRVRLGIDRMVREGYLRNVSGIGPADFGDVDYWSARLSIVGDLTPNLENYIVFNYNKSNTNGPLQKVLAFSNNGLGPLLGALQVPMGTGFYNVTSNIENPSSDLDQWQAINTTTWHASDTLTIRNIASYGELKQTFNAPLFGLDLAVPYGPPLGTFRVGFTGINAPPNTPSAHQSTFTEELQFQGRSADNRLTWQAGAYFELSKPLGDSGSQSPVFASCVNSQALLCTDALLPLVQSLVPPGTPPEFIPTAVGSITQTIGRTSYRDVALYAQGTFKFNDRLRTTAGFRYTWDRTRNVSNQRIFSIASPIAPPFIGATGVSCTYAAAAPSCITDVTLKTSAPTWTIDLEYTPSENVMAYIKYSRGYRAGVIAPNVAAPFNIVRQEKVDTYEAGLKASFRGPVRGTMSAAAFYNDFTNQQIQVGFFAAPNSGVAPSAAAFNVPKSRIWGVEFDGTLSVVEGLDLSASYAYLNTEIREVTDLTGVNAAPYILQPNFAVGDPNPLSPRHRLTLGATYTLPLDDSAGRISLGVTYTYRSSMLVNYNDRLDVATPAISRLSVLPALSLWNLNANWRGVLGTSFDLAAFVTNLTNKKYVAYTAGLGSNSAQAPGFETGVLGEPRMFGARLRYRFGS